MGIFSRFIGAKGENQATLYLKKEGYKILEKNYKTYHGEIDIIAQKGDLLVFVEVKKRKNDQMGKPEEYVSLSKRKKIIFAAKNYTFYNDLVDANCRFDVISILGEEITHIQNAFEG